MIKQTNFIPIQFGITHEIPPEVKRLEELGNAHGGREFANSNYFVGKCAQTWEKLQGQMGIGPRAWALPIAHDAEPGEDGYYAYCKWINDHGI
jgi:hypothetical protein